MDYNKYADEAMDLIRLIEKDGARLPGTPEEKAACAKLEKEMEKTGLTPKTEEFVYAPNAGIGMINKLGWAAFFFTVLYYIAPILALVGFIGIIVFTLMQIFRYTEFWDFAFKKETAKNIITEVQPVSGKVDYTIVLGAHYDSSWCWKLAVKNPDTAIIKTIYGVLGIIVMIVASILSMLMGPFAVFYNRVLQIILYVLPVVFFPGFFWITQFTTQDKTIGSPGAMDNLTGIAINMMIMKHFNAHPEELPENCLLRNVAFASEEAGLKGSKNYVKMHKDDPDFKNCYVINIDSIADKDHFEAVKADPWQGTKFDQNMIDLTLESMREAGIVNPATIVNPIGGCDSTPFCQQGIPTLTIAAQNPKSTSYYHTCNDKSERFETSTVGTGIEVVYRLIGKIGAQRGSKPAAAKAPEAAPAAQDDMLLDLEAILSDDAEE